MSASTRRSIFRSFHCLIYLSSTDIVILDLWTTRQVPRPCQLPRKCRLSRTTSVITGSYIRDPFDAQSPNPPLRSQLIRHIAYNGDPFQVDRDILPQVHPHSRPRHGKLRACYIRESTDVRIVTFFSRLRVCPCIASIPLAAVKLKLTPCRSKKYSLHSRSQVSTLASVACNP